MDHSGSISASKFSHIPENDNGMDEEDDFIRQ